MAELCGKWQLVKSINFEAYMKAIGFDEKVRERGGTAKPIVEISNSGEQWTIKTISIITSDVSFKVGEEFHQPRMDGVMVKTVVNLEGDKMVQKLFGDKEVTITREIVDGDLTVTTVVGDITSTRIYKRI